MSKLGKVLENLGERYTLNGEVFILKSLTGKNLGLFEKTEKDDVDLPYKIVHASLVESYEDVTFDEVLNIPIASVAEMVELVMTASGFNVDELKNKE